MKETPVVIFIDDEPDQIQYFMDQINGMILPGESEAATVLHHKVDGAVEFLQAFRPEIKAVIIDIKMPPGLTFQEDDHDQNLRTGLLLFEHLDGIQKKYDVNRGHPLPLAFLTQLNDKKIHSDMTELFHRLRPLELPRIGIWIKVGLEPRDFAVQFDEWLAAIHELYGIK